MERNSFGATERLKVAALLAAAIVASDEGEWDHAAVAENAWDLLQHLESEGAKRLGPVAPKGRTDARRRQSER